MSRIICAFLEKLPLIWTKIFFHSKFWEDNKRRRIIGFIKPIKYSFEKLFEMQYIQLKSFAVAGKADSQFNIDFKKELTL